MVSLTDRHFLRLLLSCCVASTSAPVLAGSKFLPVLNRPITDRSGLAGSPFVVNLSAAFGMEPVDDEVVRFTSQFSSGAVPVTMDMALFSNRTPVTRQNFLKYVTDGDYVNSFVHRSVPGFVIQGGASNIINGSIGNIPTDPPITNEFDVSNTVGTISMAKLGGNPNSATSQWFVSLGANSDILDPQNGGFTVFGRVTRSTFQNAQSFGNPSIFPTFNYGGIYAELPLFSTHAPPNRQISEFILFPSVALVPMPAGEAGESSFLAYSVISNSNPGVATASIGPVGFLNLSPAVGQSGTTAIRVRATDSQGNTVEDTFVLTVVANDTYTTWASRNTFTRGQSASGQNPDADAWNNFLEYAFLGDPGVARPSEQIIFQESLGMAPGYQALTFPVRKSAPSLSYAVEGNDGLSGPWTEIWKSTDGFVHPQVVTAVDQVDRTVLTIKDTSAIGAVSKRFMRVRAVE
jgi:cyclophilin family peptidyl-prolyl cis-trans isomerase